MTAGMPGVGLGGIYYIILALLMPFHELWQVLRGRSSWARWRMVGKQVGNAVGILAAMALTSWALVRMARVAKASRRAQDVGAIPLAWVTVAALGFVIGGVLALSVVFAIVQRLRRPTAATIPILELTDLQAEPAGSNSL